MLQYGNQVIEVELIDEENQKSKVESSVAEYILLEIEGDIFEFKNEGFKNIFNHLKTLDLENTPALQGYFLNHQNDDVRKLTTDILISPYELSSNWKERHHIITEMEDRSPLALYNTVARTIVAFKLRNVELLILKRQHELDDKYQKKEEYESIIHEIEQLNKAKSTFSEKLTRIILK